MLSSVSTVGQLWCDRQRSNITSCRAPRSVRARGEMIKPNSDPEAVSTGSLPLRRS
jgi:hypothetical protein